FSPRPLIRGLQFVVGEHEVLLVERLVTVEAGGEIGAGIGCLVGLEGLIFPFAVAHIVRVLGAPARTLLHHGIADEIGLDEAAVRVLLWIALRVQLGGVLHERDNGAARQWLPSLGGVDRRRADIELAVLLVVRPIDGRKQHALGIILGKSHLVAAGAG